MMHWTEAELKLRKNIHLKSHIDRNYKYKIVISVPPVKCNRRGEEGFRIQVGEFSSIDVTFNMLEVLFEASVKNNGIYNNAVFLECYPSKLASKPCYVQSIGRLLEYAGVARKINKREFQIL